MPRGNRRSQLSKHTGPIQGSIVPDSSRVIHTLDAEERISTASSTRQGSDLLSSANNVGIYGGSMISAAGNITIVHAPPENENTSAQVRNEGNTTQYGPVQETETLLSSSVRRPHPQRSCEVYYQNLVTKRRGSPLWIPEPSYNLPIQYQRKGVSIGDVGVLSASGTFTFFFNICLPSDHPINLMGVPEGFYPVSPPLIRREIQSVQEFTADSYIASESIETSRRHRGDSLASDLIFESAAEQGAILTMPHGARSEDLVNTLRFRGYIARNIENWYRFIIGVCGCEAANGDVRLVIGCDKTDLWGMAAFVRSSETVRLMFHPLSVGQSYKWEYSGTSDTRTGPDPAGIEGLQQSSDDGLVGEETYNNQCLFVRTLNANLNPKVWQDIALKIYSDMGIDFEEFLKGQTHESSMIMQTGPLTAASAGGSGESSLVGNVEKGKAATGRLSFEESSLSSDSNVSVAMMQHPSNMINELLWESLHEKHSTAKAIITDDSVWINVLQSNDGATLPNAYELYQRIVEQGPEINIDQEHDFIFISLRLASNRWMFRDNETIFNEPTSLFPVQRSLEYTLLSPEAIIDRIVETHPDKDNLKLALTQMETHASTLPDLRVPPHLRFLADSYINLSRINRILHDWFNQRNVQSNYPMRQQVSAHPKGSPDMTTIDDADMHAFRKQTLRKEGNDDESLDRDQVEEFSGSSRPHERQQVPAYQEFLNMKTMDEADMHTYRRKMKFWRMDGMPSSYDESPNEGFLASATTTTKASASRSRHYSVAGPLPPKLLKLWEIYDPFVESMKAGKASAQGLTTSSVDKSLDQVNLKPILPHSDQEEAFMLHPLLRYSQREIVPGHFTSILWDLRESPVTARHVSYLDGAIGEAELSHYATSPPLPVLNITCDLFPVPWVIQAQNEQGVTVLNVLETIFAALGEQIRQTEWDNFSEKHRQRVHTAFESRCSLSVNPALSRSQGVLRVDCLAYHIWFGGLSVSHEAENSCLLSLRRPQSGLARSSA